MHFSEAYKVADTVYELRSDAVKLCKAKSPQVDKRCTSYTKSLEYPPNCSRLTQQDLIIRELEKNAEVGQTVENRLKAD